MVLGGHMRWSRPGEWQNPRGEKVKDSRLEECVRTKVLGAKPPGDPRAGARGAGRRPPAWCGCGGRPAVPLDAPQGPGRSLG